MFEQTNKNIDDILHKQADCGSELDYVEQTSGVLFPKNLGDLEKDLATLFGRDKSDFFRPIY
jgi:type I restriction enzyme M protein